MRKIYNIVGTNVSEAWIGQTAPVPDGWHLDTASALAARTDRREVDRVVMTNNQPDMNEAFSPPRKRGRPKKG